MNGVDLIQAAIARRAANGLSVEVTLEGREPFVRHCVDTADRDAYIARCKARGEPVHIVGEPVTIEAFLTASDAWWVMPYKFASRADADGFLARLKQENPGREFRIAGALS